MLRATGRLQRAHTGSASEGLRARGRWDPPGDLRHVDDTGALQPGIHVRDGARGRLEERLELVGLDRRTLLDDQRGEPRDEGRRL